MDNKKCNPNIRAIKLWHSLCSQYFPLMFANAVFANLSPFFNIYMSAEIVNEISGARNKNTIILLVSITIFGNFFISIIGGILNREYGHKTTLFNQRESVLFNNKTLTLDYDKLENAEVRQLRRKINESAMINNHGKQLLIDSINSLVNNIINLAFAAYLFIEMIVLIIAAEFNWAALLFAGLIIVLILLNVWMDSSAEKSVSKISNDLSQTMIDENRIGESLDCYNMGKDVRLYRQDKLIMNIKEYTLNLHKKSFKKLFDNNFKVHIPMSILSYLLQATVYIFVCIYAVKGVFGIGSIIKYVGFTQRLIDSIINISNITAQIKYNTPFVEDYLAFFDIPRKMSQGTLHIQKCAFYQQNAVDYEVEFRNVSFKYPSSDTYALRNISLKLKVGERLAVVGQNGSGKTTFIKLLCRLYDPTEGEILLNGINIKDYNYDEYMSAFSVVFQDFKLFSFSLAQNVASKVDYDKEKVESCLTEANFGHRLAEMPDGVDTYLYRDFDEKGVEISGGEAQKIAIARALYKDAPFIILDEPTAALDPIAEFEIYKNFNEIVGNKTAIYISHRLSSCRFCDDIVVFNEGRLIQRGSHDTLVADTKGKYYELWNAQAQYYKENKAV